MSERNPKYDGLYVFKPDLTKILPGDILLTRNREAARAKGKAQSDFIAAATGGSFSHALLCTVPPTFIEAIGDFVSNISVQNCFSHSLANVRALRYSDAKVAKAAGSVALRFLGQGYSVRSVILSILPEATLPAQVGDRTFCSALVATAYRAAGAPEFQTIDPMKVTPATLEHMSHLIDVTDSVFTRILSPQNIELMSALDGDRIVTPLGPQGKLFNSYYQKLSPRIREIIANYPTKTRSEPTSFADCLFFLIDEIVACETLQDPSVRKHLGRALKVVDDLAFRLLTEGTMAQILQAATRVDAENSAWLISESFKDKPDIALNDVQGLLSVTISQIASRSSIFDDSSRPSGRSLVWDEWIKMTRDNLESFRLRKETLEEVIQRVFPSTKRQTPSPAPP